MKKRPNARCRHAVTMTEAQYRKLQAALRSVKRVRAHVEALERVCAEAYQFAGAVGAPERVLDNLLAASEGRQLPHESILPVLAEECDAVREARGR